MARFEYTCTFAIEGEISAILEALTGTIWRTVGNTIDTDTEGLTTLREHPEQAVRMLMVDAIAATQITQTLRERLSPLEIAHLVERDEVQQVGQEGPTADYGG